VCFSVVIEYSFTLVIILVMRGLCEKIQSYDNESKQGPNFYNQVVSEIYYCWSTGLPAKEPIPYICCKKVQSYDYI